MSKQTGSPVAGARARLRPKHAAHSQGRPPRLRRIPPALSVFQILGRLHGLPAPAAGCMRLASQAGKAPSSRRPRLPACRMRPGLQTPAGRPTRTQRRGTGVCQPRHRVKAGGASDGVGGPGGRRRRRRRRRGRRLVALGGLGVEVGAQQRDAGACAHRRELGACHPCAGRQGGWCTAASINQRVSRACISQPDLFARGSTPVSASQCCSERPGR
jgi:hypothetical protein